MNARHERYLWDAVIRYYETPLPLERYHAVVELDDAPGGGCRVRWGSNWIAKGVPDAQVREMLVGLYGRLIDGLAGTRTR